VDQCSRWAGLAGAGDDDVAQKPQQLRHGARDQPGVQFGAGLLPALHCHGNGEVDMGQQADHGPAMPGLPADDLPCVQADGPLGELVIFLDGLIAIDVPVAGARLRDKRNGFTIPPQLTVATAGVDAIILSNHGGR
jgi:hypothetical protein